MNDKPIKNYGLNWQKEIADQSPEDWVVGAQPLPDFAEIPEAERGDYLPAGEVQMSDIEDMMDCASRAPINILEAKFTYLYLTGKLIRQDADWLQKEGYVNGGRVMFSDAFVAINSGTTRDGNSLKAPLDAIRKQGLIPKKLMPLEKWMTFDYYHDPNRITQAIRNLGMEFLNRFIINYEKVYSPDFSAVLKKDMLDVAGFAWPEPKNGIYPMVTTQPNHAFVIWKNPPYFAFDNYLDTHDQDFVKQLAPNYELTHGYRVLVNVKKKLTSEEEYEQPKSLWQRFLDWLGL